MSKGISMRNKEIQNISMNVSKLIGSLVLIMGLLLTALPAMASEEAQYDDVFINGYKLGFFEQLALEDHIDRDIADGIYWFELDTGMWGPVGGTAIGHIVIPAEYQDYVESKLSQPSQVTKVELSASAEECDNDCLYW
jgi:hypothetical protein